MLVRALVIALLVGWTEIACAADVLLRWPALLDADGYRLYVGTQSRAYTETHDLGALTADTIGGVVHFLATGLGNGHYFLALTTYNSAGESDYSNEKEVPLDTVEPPVADAGPDLIGVVGQTMAIGTDGGGSSYVWLQRRGPPLALTDPASSRTSFVAQQPGRAELVLIAYDSEGIASTASITITVADVPLPMMSAAMCLLTVLVLTGLAWQRMT